MTGDVPHCAWWPTSIWRLAKAQQLAWTWRCVMTSETLAEATATAVLQHLNAGRAPVALLAQDRVVVRRVRALLGRQGVPVLDETGWTLATTPAAAALMALLRANTRPVCRTTGWPGSNSPLTAGWEPAPLASLEALCRRKGWRQPERLDPLDLPVWHRVRDLTAPLRGDRASWAPGWPTWGVCCVRWRR